MSRSTRWMLAVLLGGATVAVAGLGVAGAAVYRAGSIAVDVQDHGSDFQLSVPAALAHVAIAVAPASLVREAAIEVEPLLPAARAAWTQLAATPDFVLVEVVSAGERVLVEKRGSQLLVRVESDGAQFRVALPLRVVGALLNKLERAA